MMEKFDKESFAERFDMCGGSVPVMLEDGRMGLCSHVNDTHALVDVYRENDHQVMLHVPYENIVDVFGRVVAGLKDVDRSEDPEGPPPPPPISGEEDVQQLYPWQSHVRRIG